MLAYPSMAVALCLTFSLAGATGGALLETLPDANRPTNVALLVVIAVNTYASGTYLIKERYSFRRLAVSGSPNRQLFRALDITVLPVFWTYCLRRIITFHSLVMASTIAALVGLSPSSKQPAPQTTALLAAILPLASTLLISAVAAINTTWPVHRRPGTSAVVLGASLFAIAGMSIGRIAVGLDTDSMVSTAQVRGESLLVALWVGVISVIVVSTLLLTRSARSIWNRGFDHTPVRYAATSRFGSRLIPSDSARGLLLGVLNRQLSSGPTSPFLDSTLRRTALLTALVAGARAGGVPAVPSGWPGTAARAALIGFTFVSFTIATGFVTKETGPTRTRHQLRNAYDNWSMDASSLSVISTVGVSGPIVALGAMVGVLLALATGHGWIRPIGLAAALFSSAFIGELLFQSREAVDGSSDISGLVAVVVLAGSLPAMVLANSSLTLAAPLLILYAFTLSTGMVWIRSKRLVTRQ